MNDLSNADLGLYIDDNGGLSAWRIVGIRDHGGGPRAVMIEVRRGVLTLLGRGEEADAQKQADAFIAGSQSGFGFKLGGQVEKSIMDKVLETHP